MNSRGFPATLICKNSTGKKAMPKGLRYLFGRLNIIPIQELNEKRNLLYEGLRHDTLLEKRGTVWGFYEVREISSEYGDFVHGYLVKYRPHTIEEVVIPETRQLDEQAIRNLVKAKARFFLHISSGLIAYHPVGREIRRDTFADRFVQLFQQALGNFFVDAEIQTIQEPYRIFEAMKKFQRISAVSIYLHPSNPSLRDVWKRTDNRLKQVGAANYSEKYESKPDGGGLSIVEDEDVNSKIAMAEDGYGHAEITGTMEDHPMTVSTRDSPISSYSGADEDAPELVLERLSSTIRRVFSRFEK
jgi:hypothetical protein